MIRNVLFHIIPKLGSSLALFVCGGMICSSHPSAQSSAQISSNIVSSATEFKILDHKY